MDAASPAAPSDPVGHRSRRGVSGRRQGLSAAVSVVVLLLLTLALQRAGDAVSDTIVFLAYLAVVVGLSAAGGTIVGVATAVVAFLIVNFSFSAPVRTFDVADTERVAELLIFLGVSGTVAVLVDTATHRRDVLEVKTAEARQLAAANDLRVALLRAVSHDLRTPLTTAKMATSSLLAEDVELDPAERKELLLLADAEIDRLVLIVENLLDAGRLQTGGLTVRLASVAVADVIAQALASLPPGRRQRVDVVVDDSLPPVRTDVVLLERVVANLVTNALDADPVGRVEVTARVDDGLLELVVLDHGPGLDEHQRVAALRPFQRYEDRGSNGGIGLGLTICAGFCDAMGADLDLLATPGSGVTARIGLEVVR